MAGDPVARGGHDDIPGAAQRRAAAIPGSAPHPLRHRQRDVPDRCRSPSTRTWLPTIAGLSVRATDVRPSTVELRFERRVTREIEVEPFIEASPAPGYVIIGDPILDPPTVTVRGIESVVDTVALIRTERLSLRNVTRSETHRLVLQLPADPSRLSVEPPQRSGHHRGRLADGAHASGAAAGDGTSRRPGAARAERRPRPPPGAGAGGSRTSRLVP